MQHGYNLGLRMHHAFAGVFEEGYTSVLIVGSDCYQLPTEIVVVQKQFSMKLLPLLKN